MGKVSLLRTSVDPKGSSGCVPGDENHLAVDEGGEHSSTLDEDSRGGSSFTGTSTTVVPARASADPAGTSSWRLMETEPVTGLGMGNEEWENRFPRRGQSGSSLRSRDLMQLLGWGRMGVAGMSTTTPAVEGCDPWERFRYLLARERMGCRPRTQQLGMYCTVCTTASSSERWGGDQHTGQAASCSRILEPQNAFGRQNARMFKEKEPMTRVADKMRPSSEPG